MINTEAYKILGERTLELAKNKDVQRKMVEIARNENKEAAEKYLYMLAIATLCGA